MILYSMIQFWFWFMLGSLCNYANVLFVAKGLSASQIGFLVAGACMMAAVLEGPLSSIAESGRNVTAKTVAAFAAGGIIVFSLFAKLTYDSLPWPTVIFYTTGIMLVQATTPFVNAIGTESMNQGRRINFGVARGIGSIGYAIMSYSLGWMTQRLGASFLPIAAAVSATIFLICVIAFPLEKKENTADTPRGTAGEGTSRFFGKYPRFIWVLLGCLLVYACHDCLNSFLYQIVLSKGGNSADMGTAMFIGALAELPVMFLFQKMLRKKPSVFWFRLSGFFYVIKALGTLAAANMGAMYCVQLLQMFSWALITVASVYYVNSLMGEGDTVKGQAYLNVAYICAKVFGSVLGGVLIDEFSVNVMLAVSAVLAFIGTLLIVLKTDGKKLHMRSALP